MEKSGIKIAAQNRKARHDYFVEERYEAGIELFGTEVKSIRQGTLNLKDSFANAKDGELYVYNMHISPYEHGNIFNRDPDRPKRLLMHKREIRKLHDLQKQLRADPPVGVLQKQPGKGGAGPLQGQEELRQAPGHRRAGRQAGDGQGKKGTVLI